MSQTRRFDRFVGLLACLAWLLSGSASGYCQFVPAADCHREAGCCQANVGAEPEPTCHADAAGVPAATVSLAGCDSAPAETCFCPREEASRPVERESLLPREPGRATAVQVIPVPGLRAQHAPPDGRPGRVPDPAETGGPSSPRSPPLS
ncbi:MAG: hypothetical protein R6X14_00295 [bacterium]